MTANRVNNEIACAETQSLEASEHLAARAHSIRSVPCQHADAVRSVRFLRLRAGVEPEPDRHGQRCCEDRLHHLRARPALDAPLIPLTLHGMVEDANACRPKAASLPDRRRPTMPACRQVTVVPKQSQGLWYDHLIRAIPGAAGRSP